MNPNRVPIISTVMLRARLSRTHWEGHPARDASMLTCVSRRSFPSQWDLGATLQSVMNCELERPVDVSVRSC